MHIFLTLPSSIVSFLSFYSVFAQCLPRGQEAELAGFL
jgi:hypothetical protein